MSAVERFDTGSEETDTEETTGSVLGVTPDAIEVRRNGGLAALIGALASAVAIAYLARAVQSGAVLDWALFAVMAIVGATWLHALVDARTPLMVADTLGVRLRLGKVWRGLPWGALESVEHTPRRGLLHDGLIVLVPHNPARVRDELDASGRRQSRISETLYGAPLAVPLGLSTKVSGLDLDLTTSLRQLAGATTRVVEPTADHISDDVEVDEPDDMMDESHDTDIEEPGPVELDVDVDVDVEAEVEVEAGEGDEAEQESWSNRIAVAFAAFKSTVAARTRGRDEFENADASRDDTATLDSDDLEAHDDAHDLSVPLRASATPSPLREAAPATRVEIRSNLFLQPTDLDETSEAGTPRVGRELRREGSVPLVEEASVWGDRVRPIAMAQGSVEPLVIDDFAVEPAADPVIGPEITAARTRIGLSVDALAERTRIRPHVIESIEVDDFAPCGGDFYARGHLRTLARVLGLDIAPLLKSYDEKYADAPINPRKVFEAELATGSNGGIRSTRGGPNWSVLIAAIMTLVLAWSIARLVMDTPVELQSPAPILNGSGGPNQPVPTVQNVTLKVSANGSSHIEVRNGKGKLVFNDDVTYGDVHRIDVLPPVQVKASDAGAVDVEIDGRERGSVGVDGKVAKKTYRGGN